MGQSSKCPSVCLVCLCVGVFTLSNMNISEACIRNAKNLASPTFLHFFYKLRNFMKF